MLRRAKYSNQQAKIFLSDRAEKLPLPPAAAARRESILSMDTMMMDIYSDLGDAVSCSLCAELFNGTNRLPRALSCMHTFCTSCLYMLAQRTQMTMIECPNCRRPTPLQSQTLRSIVCNYSILAAAEAYKSQEETGKSLPARLSETVARNDSDEQEAIECIDCVQMNESLLSLPDEGLCDSQLKMAAMLQTKQDAATRKIKGSVQTKNAVPSEHKDDGQTTQQAAKVTACIRTTDRPEDVVAVVYRSKQGLSRRDFDVTNATKPHIEGSEDAENSEVKRVSLGSAKDGAGEQEYDRGEWMASGKRKAMSQRDSSIIDHWSRAKALPKQRLYQPSHLPPLPISPTTNPANRMSALDMIDGDDAFNALRSQVDTPNFGNSKPHADDSRTTLPTTPFLDAVSVGQARLRNAGRVALKPAMAIDKLGSFHGQSPPAPRSLHSQQNGRKT